jgi:2-dehydro-3-deoxy-D-gluconate 5-dehydrogenase
MIDLELEGSVAIVTGASRGLGRAIALALAEQGARVLAVARSVDELQEVQGLAPGHVRISACDMLDAAAVARLPDEAVREFGRVDIVVNNAGIAPAGKFVEQSDEVWDKVMAVNVTAPAILARAAGRHLIAQGSGKIINIASTSGILGKATLVAYSASKGALLQFTKALAAEWAGHGIQVNAVAPGAFATEAQRAVLDSPEMLERRTRKIPARRMGQTREIGALVCYLASRQSEFVTGSVFVIDGGESCKL